MALGRYAVTRRATDWLEVTLEGDIDPSVVMSCEREVRAQIVLAPANLHAVINLCGVTGYQLEARESLVSLQRCIGQKASQSAYVADTAPGRALALWVIHNTQGQVVRSFTRAGEAAEWLGGADVAESGVREVRSTRRTINGRKRRAAS
jgi:hypothetical protein